MGNRKGIVRCQIIRRDVNKNEYCPGKTCDSCLESEEEKFQASRRDINRTPLGFATIYLGKGGILNFPVFRGLADEAFGKKRHVQENNAGLETLKNLSLPPSIENRIYTVLSVFLLAIIIVETRILKTLVQEEIRRGPNLKRGIRLLERFVSIPGLPDQTRTNVERDLNELRVHAKKEQVYSPIKEIAYQLGQAYLVSCKRNLDSLLNKKHRTKKDVASIASLSEKIEKRKRLLESMVAGMRIEKRKPSQFLFKALQIVIYTILTENTKIPKEKAKAETANIINEFKERRFPLIPTLTRKTVDNTLQNR